MSQTPQTARRVGGAPFGAALAAACAPLSLFATFSPKDRASRAAEGAPFGPAAHQRLDVYRPNRPAHAGSAPIAVFFYGASWDSGRRQDYGWVGRALAARGFVAVVPDYGMYPKVRYPAFLEDAALAVRWARERGGEFGGDPGRIVLAGHSAGAYNAAMIALDRRYLTAAGVDPACIKALAGLSGPYDFLPLTDPIAQRIFGEAADLPATQPLAHVTAHSPPAFLATGDRDVMVYPRNTARLAARLRKAGVTVEERRYAGIGHVDMLLALSRIFRRRAPVLREMADFLHAHADGHAAAAAPTVDAAAM